uniref:ATP-dependent Clp protease proteolytic subunit n=1 Tax=Lagarostrobos franklinii TaxID=56892 RepID=A0A3T0ZDB5_LAGFR|nr:clp protease proteolytic subunit [Lagarostrobos franklinii]BBF90865.1 ATP-dependent Clp protease proteolytic subunit [Lagarostrobos franklinii]
MPLGVPKVPQQYFEEEDAIWIDLYNRIYDERLLFLMKPIDDESVNQLTSMMVYLTIDDPTREHFLFIHSTGGLVLPGMGLYDLMQYIPPEVNTAVVGMAASMGSVILTGGHPGTRLAFPHATVMIHQPAGTHASGLSSMYTAETADELTIIKDQVVSIYLETTKQKSRLTIWNDLDRDLFLSPEKAVEYGIIDIVINSEMDNPWIILNIRDDQNPPSSPENNNGHSKGSPKKNNGNSNGSHKKNNGNDKNNGKPYLNGFWNDQNPTINSWINPLEIGINGAAHTPSERSTEEQPIPNGTAADDHSTEEQPIPNGTVADDHSSTEEVPTGVPNESPSSPEGELDTVGYRSSELKNEPVSQILVYTIIGALILLATIIKLFLWDGTL